MLKITPEIIEKAKKIRDTQLSNAAGYRIKVFCLEADDTYSSTSGEKGVIVKPENQKERETRGSDAGIIVHVGKGAFKGEHLGKQGDWAEVGQVVLYQNYAGKTTEEPKGSGNMYRTLNDEDVLNYYPEKCDEA